MWKCARIEKLEIKGRSAVIYFICANGFAELLRGEITEHKYIYAFWNDLVQHNCQVAEGYGNEDIIIDLRFLLFQIIVQHRHPKTYKTQKTTI